MIAFQDIYADHKDRFELLAIHDGSVKSFDELDKKLPPLKARYWQNRDLPFPILLDSEGKTIERLGVNKFPTTILIDPDGKLVGEAELGDLAAKLPQVSAGKWWTVRRDIAVNVWWTFSPENYTLKRMETILSNWSGQTITLDADALKGAGLTPDNSLPGFVIGSGLSLRSLDELLLAPLGLGIVPAPDDKSLTISTRKQSPDEKRSYQQRLIENELTAKMQTGLSAKKSVTFKDEPLTAALTRLSEEYRLAFALNTAQIHAKTLDPKLKVTGTIEPAKLRDTLQALLKPHELQFDVTSEVIRISKGKAP